MVLGLSVVSRLCIILMLGMMSLLVSLVSGISMKVCLVTCGRGIEMLGMLMTVLLLISRLRLTACGLQCGLL